MAEGMNLARRVERYENLHQSKRATAVEHEELYYLIDHQIGHVEAQFFDKEHMLPFAVRGLPWPMRRHDASSFVLLRLLLTVLVGFCIAMLFSPADLMLSIVVGSATAGAFYLLATHAPKLLPPGDLEKRIQLVNKFTDMQVTAVAENERVAEERRAKQLHEPVTVKLPSVEVRRIARRIAETDGRTR